MRDVARRIPAANEISRSCQRLMSDFRDASKDFAGRRLILCRNLAALLLHYRE
jgi:hypothetical protein